MARLEDLMPEIQIKLKSSAKNNSRKEPNNKPIGKKRRPWLEDGDIITPKKSDPSTAFINGVYKSGLSIGLINRVYRPHNEKGSIKGVYRPDLLRLTDLRNNPLQLIRFFFELAKEEGDGYKTRKIKLREVIQQLNISKNSAKTALRFLIKQNLIAKIEFKVGKLGWSKYELKEVIYKEIEKALSKGSIDPFPIVKFIEPVKGSNSSSSINNTTTTIIDPNWKNIDVSPLEKIGVTQKHLQQLKSKTTQEVVQESINHFSYALQHNPKVKKYDSPIAAFISVLKRGEAWIEPNYRSSQEIAQEQLLKSKKAEKERLKRLEDEAYTLALEEWKEALTDEKREEISSKKGRGDIIPSEIKINLYFKENIWPEKKKAYWTSGSG